MATTLPETSDLGLPDGRDSASGPLLEVIDLHVEFRTRDNLVRAVNGITYSLGQGETLAILGESGSGKSVSAQAVMGILDSPPAFITQGDIRFRGEDMLAMPEEQRRKIRGRRIAMIFQDALSSLNPVFTVGDQIGEMFRVHMGMSKKESLARAADLMDRVRIPSAKQRIHDYPHQFSGGMRQRVMIAMALSLEPDVVIADEPTTALDVTVQAQIMKLLKELQTEMSMGLILITHDLGVVADVADRICVMYAGKIVEQANVNWTSTRTAGPSVHRGSAPVHPPGRPQGAEAHHDHRPAAEPGPHPVRVLVPSPLPARAGDLHDRRTGAARGRRGP